MTTLTAKVSEITMTVGCQPSTDKTAFATQHAVMMDKVRVFQGLFQKIGGWQQINFDYGNAIKGVCRRIFSAYLAAQTNQVTVLGTSQNLYALVGTRLTNITPFNTATTAIPSSLTNDYRTLGTNPVTTVNGSSTVIITDANAGHYQVGDSITLSGFATVNGITGTMLNMAQIVRSVGAGSYTIQVSGIATASGSGGGASCVIASGLITAHAVAHGMTTGQRVKLLGAASFGGVTAAQINLEFIVRVLDANDFAVMTAGVATNSVTGGGGTGTTYQTQIAAGNQDENAAQGYGAGYYGVGLYGTALQSQQGLQYPRIWFIDRFEADIVMTAGNQSGIYTWNGTTSTAPALLANAPTDVNYVFVSNDIVVTFGHENVGNQIFASDIQDPTNWTASSSNQVFQGVVSGANTLIGHIPVNGVNLIFSNNQTYIFQYIGLPLVWSYQLLSNHIGIIAPLAGLTVNGVAYWMGQDNFYMWFGGNIQVIPANSQPVSTILNYVFGNLTQGQQSKIFAWYNERVGEIWWHYPSSAANEPDRVARLNVNEGYVWTIDTFDRTAAEAPNVLSQYPKLTDAESTLYSHEYGTDANGAPMAFTLTSNIRYSGINSGIVTSVVPDSIQSGDVSLGVNGYDYPQSGSPSGSSSITISPTTTLIQPGVGGRYWQYTWSGNALGQQWAMGRWQEYIQASGAKA